MSPSRVYAHGLGPGTMPTGLHNTYFRHFDQRVKSIRRGKFSSGKINCRGKLSVGKNYSQGESFVTMPKYRHFSTTNFSQLRYPAKLFTYNDFLFKISKFHCSAHGHTWGKYSVFLFIVQPMAYMREIQCIYVHCSTHGIHEGNTVYLCSLFGPWAYMREIQCISVHCSTHGIHEGNTVYLCSLFNPWHTWGKYSVFMFIVRPMGIHEGNTVYLCSLFGPWAYMREIQCISVHCSTHGIHEGNTVYLCSLFGPWAYMREIQCISVHCSTHGIHEGNTVYLCSLFGQWAYMREIQCIYVHYSAHGHTWGKYSVFMFIVQPMGIHEGNTVYLCSLFGPWAYMREIQCISVHCSTHGIHEGNTVYLCSLFGPWAYMREIQCIYVHYSAHGHTWGKYSVFMFIVQPMGIHEGNTVYFCSLVSPWAYMREIQCIYVHCSAHGHTWGKYSVFMFIVQPMSIHEENTVYFCSLFNPWEYMREIQCISVQNNYNLQKKKTPLTNYKFANEGSWRVTVYITDPSAQNQSYMYRFVMFLLVNRNVDKNHPFSQELHHRNLLIHKHTPLHSRLTLFYNNICMHTTKMFLKFFPTMRWSIYWNLPKIPLSWYWLLNYLLKNVYVYVECNTKMIKSRTYPFRQTTPHPSERTYFMNAPLSRFLMCIGSLCPIVSIIFPRPWLYVWGV